MTGDARQHFHALITAIKMFLAGLIGFILVNYFHLPEGVWCLVTIAAITQVGLQQTLAKSLMRAIGTITGAIAGYAIAVFAKGDPAIIIALIFTMIFVTSYIALQPTIYSYAGIVTGMTMAIVVFFSLAHQNFYSIAVDRTIEVLLGIIVLAIINFFLFFLVKKFFPNNIKKATLSWQLPQFKFNANYVISALKVASACVFTFLIWYYCKQPEGYWATITCLLIMEENQHGTFKKGFFRFFSHLVATILGLICVLALLHLPYTWRLIPLLITFFACGFLIGSENQYASMGNTLGIAVAIMLLTTPDAHDTLHIIFARFYNVMIGVVVAFSVLFFKWRRV